MSKGKPRQREMTRADAAKKLAKNSWRSKPGLAERRSNNRHHRCDTGVPDSIQ